ncbi:MAG: hypothetical protein HY767_02875, partial [Candidatus Omnitrophica bacterium]|nr:hypothetical protein [Candidatus Omnitrophota bacterium]
AGTSLPVFAVLGGGIWGYVVVKQVMVYRAAQASGQNLSVHWLRNRILGNLIFATIFGGMMWLGVSPPSWAVVPAGTEDFIASKALNLFGIPIPSLPAIPGIPHFDLLNLGSVIQAKGTIFGFLGDKVHLTVQAIASAATLNFLLAVTTQIPNKMREIMMRDTMVDMARVLNTQAKTLKEAFAGLAQYGISPTTFSLAGILALTGAYGAKEQTAEWFALSAEQKAGILKLIQRDLSDGVYGMDRYDAGLALAALHRAILENDPTSQVSISEKLARGQGVRYRWQVNAAARREVLTSASFWVSMVFGTFSMWVVTHEIAAIVHYAEGVDAFFRKFLGEQFHLFSSIIKTIEGDPEKQKQYAEMAQRGEYVPPTDRLVASGALGAVGMGLQEISSNLVIQPYIIAKQAAEQAPVLKTNLVKIADERFGLGPTAEKAAFIDNARRQIAAMEKTTYASILGQKIAGAYEAFSKSA